jgi:hypothetical protein
MSKPREMTVEECREKFLAHVWTMIDYWDKTPSCGDHRNRIEGLAFSMLAAIDGSAMAMPGWVLAPTPHKDDAEYNRQQGQNWWPSACVPASDIAGCLHEHFHDTGRKLGLLAGRQQG